MTSHRRWPEDERGSGGKTLRGRRPPPPATPYERPTSSIPQPRNPSWISGILSGAGKLISSVFGPDDSSQSYSSSYDSDGDYYSSDEDEDEDTSEDEDIDTTAEELCELDQGGDKCELMRDHVEASSAIVPKSESKLAIEQLLMQETFSRDECKKLMEILQSRVINYPSAEVGEDGSHKETHNTSGCAVSCIGGYQSLHPHNEVQDKITHSSDILNSLSPGFSALQARRTDVRATVVMEANKWLEEKKLSSSLNANLDCGPCTLNTHMLHCAFEDELGSPVDIAKSYMRSLPPRQSSPLSSIGFRTPQPSGTPFYKDHTYATTSNSLPSLKALKRRCLATESWNTHDEIRRVRMKSTDNLLEIPNGKIDPSTCLLESKASKISSAAEKRELPAEYHWIHCINRSLSLPDEKGTEENCSMETGNAFAVSIVSNLEEEALNAGHSPNESAMQTTSVPSQSKLGSEIKFSDLEARILDENESLW